MINLYRCSIFLISSIVSLGPFYTFDDVTCGITFSHIYSQSKAVLLFIVEINVMWHMMMHDGAIVQLR